jgi:hypothetical protein
LTVDEIHRQIRIAYEYCYVHDEWVNPLAEALDGVKAEEAAWRPPDGKGIWDIVLHLAVWNENILERMETGEKSSPAEGHWPLPEEPDELAWEAAKERLSRSLEGLRLYLETHSLDEMTGAYGLADLFCRFHHIAYHLGQITKVRELRERPA